jgi:mono/diheme cytochrome c family protein
MNHRITQSLGIGGFFILALASCETTPNSAFPTARALSVRQDADLATLERGRKIYTTSCTECHVARPIAQHSVTEWKHFIEIMAPRARLQSSERAALESYVIAARQSLSANASASSP